MLYAEYQNQDLRVHVNSLCETSYKKKGKRIRTMKSVKRLLQIKSRIAGDTLDWTERKKETEEGGKLGENFHSFSREKECEMRQREREKEKERWEWVCFCFSPPSNIEV